MESVSVPSSASIHEKNAIKAFASVWQIKTGETAFFQSEEVIFFNIIMIVIGKMKNSSLIAIFVVVLWLIC